MKPKTPKKPCISCEKIFQPRNKNQQHCSKECREVKFQCTVCLEVKPSTESYGPSIGNMCKTCFYLKNIKQNFGIEKNLYEFNLKKQRGKCAICGGSTKKLHIDHCHETGKIRGLLCHTCNRSIGLLKDDSVVLRKAANYLDSKGVWSDAVK